jgi:SAM-dependent methyltransferase
LALEEGATAFYDALAPMFDVMTDWGARLATEGPFLREVLGQAGVNSVLDAACGSGGHALALARWGYEVTGVDASPVMIALARNKAAEAGLALRLVVSDLERLVTATTEGRPYDAVLCLGNSLPHLLSHAALVAGLEGVARVLRPGGLFITQNLNYDLRWKHQPRFFAAQGGTLDGSEVLIWRFADYDVPAERIAFHVALFSKRTQGRDWDVEVHTTPHRPLFQAGLIAALAEAGFGVVRMSGRMALPFEPFDPEQSGDCVVVATKADGL